MPLTDGEMTVVGVGAIAVIAVGGFLLIRHFASVPGTIPATVPCLSCGTTPSTTPATVQLLVSVSNNVELATVCVDNTCRIVTRSDGMEGSFTVSPNTPYNVTASYATAMASCDCHGQTMPCVQKCFADAEYTTSAVSVQHIELTMACTQECL